MMLTHDTYTNADLSFLGVALACGKLHIGIPQDISQQAGVF